MNTYIKVLKQERDQKEKELSKIVTHGIHSQDLLDSIAEYDKVISQIEDLVCNNENILTMNLSIRLLSEVLKTKIHSRGCRITGEYVTFVSVHGKDEDKAMDTCNSRWNIFELAYKCKEWAKNSKGCVITATNIEEIFNTCELLLLKPDINL
jgi:hypothetical protein